MDFGSVMGRRGNADYVAFVRARYPALYRTGYVLTGEQELAEQLLQRGLHKAGTNWSRLSWTDTPEGYVRKEIAHQWVSWRRRRPAAAATRAGTVDTETGSECKLVWQGLARLSRQRRAVVVLSCFEELTDFEIAHVLDVPQTTVLSEMRAAVQTMSSSPVLAAVPGSARESGLGDRIGRALTEAAEAITPPEPDLDELTRRTKRAQSGVRGVFTGAATALVIAGVVFVAQLMQAGDRSGPIPPDPDPVLEVEADDTSIWSDSERLHLQGEVVVPQGEIASGLAVVEGGVVYGDRSGNVWLHRKSGSSTRVGSNLVSQPAGDATGSAAAWFENSGGTFALVVFDTAENEQLAWVDLGPDVTFHLSADDIASTSPVLSVESDVHTVHYEANGRVWSYRWTVDDAPRDIGRTADNLLDVRGAVWAVALGRQKVQFLTAAGALVLSVAGPLDQRGALSPDGRYFYGTGPQGHVFVETRSGDVFVFQPSERQDRQVIYAAGWSGADTLTVATYRYVSDKPLRGDVSPGTAWMCLAPLGECTDQGSVDDFSDLSVPPWQ